MTKKAAISHIPVMLTETLRYLNPVDGGIYVDCTGGGGGHSAAILEKIPNGKLIILDRDPEACERLQNMFKDRHNVEIINENFANLYNIMSSKGLVVNGILADFGVSIFQISNTGRGFSFRFDEPLDMRMDPRIEVSAYDVVNGFPQQTLENIIKKYGEDPFAKKIAYEIVKHRNLKKIKTTKELAEIVAKSIPMRFQKKGMNPATRTFQAIRIFINKELEAIESLLKSLEKLIVIGGRAVFISFHSLEDRLVKDFFTHYSKSCICPHGQPICTCGKKQTFRILTKKPVLPSKDEVIKNPYSRSAKLRAGERV
ncbi:MAG: 16S rRNA (cytosine(1402)-N(4))-methyltransferase RsmH [Calditerrivibrio sp.]|nr:16S rRNA (cytosine(1402)-N(4))-methyltransferase RsmH [Calditerrivibrio sp.]